MRIVCQVCGTVAGTVTRKVGNDDAGRTIWIWRITQAQRFDGLRTLTLLTPDDGGQTGYQFFCPRHGALECFNPRDGVLCYLFLPELAVGLEAGRRALRLYPVDPPLYPPTTAL